MKKIPSLLFSILILKGFVSAQSTPMKRFAGIHCDFHASLYDSAIGKTFSYAMADSFLKITKPDFIQVDCKGHMGISSYPTKVGNPVQGLKADILSIWRQASIKNKVALYVHYSGIWEERAIALHPHWARVNADGSYDMKAISLFSGYTDSLLIPQLIELSEVYKVDGAWIDGDCWFLGNDYSPAALNAFIAETGITSIPKDESEPYFFEFCEFNRKKFRSYIDHYSKAIHAINPNFRITSNWAYSSYVPEKIDADVDFLSGDVTGYNSMYGAAFESRCMADQGMPWDLMPWSFYVGTNTLSAQKTFVQAAQEASSIIAMGGGFQNYIPQNRDGSVRMFQAGEIAKVLQFCRDRQPYVQESTMIPQIGLLYSTYSWKRYSTALYAGKGMEALKGTMAVLLDNQLPVDIIMDHNLPEKLNKYPVIVYPEWKTIDPEIKSLLEEYVKNGGNLLITGANAGNIFYKDAGLNIEHPLIENSELILDVNGKVESLRTAYSIFKTDSTLKEIGIKLQQPDPRFSDNAPLAQIIPWGKGKIGFISFNSGEIYLEKQSVVIRDLFSDVMKELYRKPVSVVRGSPYVHQVIRKKNNSTLVHLINTGTQHSNPGLVMYDELQHTGILKLSINKQQKPKSVFLQPGNKKLPFKYKNNLVEVIVPSVEIYSIVEIR